ncbi:Hypothetical predicted protein [Scomber scombrus]|uniref:Uncharacterized protein n=1 Tax=Scomber scombrus TaxID=13677 RepID=A0AAV1PDP2_SCOSC
MKRRDELAALSEPFNKTATRDSGRRSNCSTSFTFCHSEGGEKERNDGRWEEEMKKKKKKRWG